jgi:uncharacterized metal-binding protein
MEQPLICTCDESPDSGPNRIIFVCSGASNVGQIANSAGVCLNKEGYGNFTCIALLATGSVEFVENVRQADQIVIIDGCPVACARTIAEDQGIAPDQYVVVTEFGIEKDHDRDPSTEEIEEIVSAVWEGKGRSGE